MYDFKVICLFWVNSSVLSTTLDTFSYFWVNNHALSTTLDTFTNFESIIVSIVRILSFLSQNRTLPTILNHIYKTFIKIIIKSHSTLPSNFLFISPNLSIDSPYMASWWKSFHLPHYYKQPKGAPPLFAPKENDAT